MTPGPVPRTDATVTVSLTELTWAQRHERLAAAGGR
jgi:hypothetical protein